MASKAKRMSQAEIAAISRPKGATKPEEIEEQEEPESPKHRRGKTFTLLMPDGREVSLDTDLTRAEVYARYPKAKIIKEVLYRNKNARKVCDADDEI